MAISIKVEENEDLYNVTYILDYYDIEYDIHFGSDDLTLYLYDDLFDMHQLNEALNELESIDYEIIKNNEGDDLIIHVS